MTVERITRKEFIVRVAGAVAGTAFAWGCSDSDDDSGHPGSAGNAGSSQPPASGAQAGSAGMDAKTSPIGSGGAAAAGRAGGVAGTDRGDANLKDAGTTSSGRPDAGTAGASGAAGASGTGSAGTTAAGTSGAAPDAGGQAGHDSGMAQSCEISMTNQHPTPHTLTIPPEDLAGAPISRVYILRGLDDHAHDLRVTADDFKTLAAGGSVEIYSMNSLGHYHIVTISGC